MPSHGIFVENRLREFRALTGAQVKVIAPVPWFPSKNESFGSWSQWARVARKETRDGVEVFHPRYFLPPKVGMTYAATALERCFERAAHRQLAEGWDFDLIDAHYYYPDGVAAVRVANMLNKPVVVTARGTDINLIPEFPRQRRMILDAAKRADLTITVAEALRAEMIRLGAMGEKIVTLRNGVNLENFRPLNQVDARQQLAAPSRSTFDPQADGPIIASVGHLIERKGHHLAIEAIHQLPGAQLIIAGDGPERANLDNQVKMSGLTDRVHFLGRKPHEDLSAVYSAADITVLASSREGWPNVLLESMACGTPCVATPVWGSGEVITAPAAGQLCTDRTPEAIAKTITAVMAAGIDRNKTRQYAEMFSWDETAANMATHYKRVIANHQRRQEMVCTPALHLSPATQPKAIVTIDTEEAFDWSQYSSRSYSVCDPVNLQRFQHLCTDSQIKPIYFLTWPMMDTEHSAAFFKSVAKARTADLGLHMHQWVTPPVTDHVSGYYSFQNNLPVEIAREKFAVLIEKFRDQFGYTTDLHRAGRYGADPLTYRLLRDFGIDYDFSPSAGFDFSDEGGPDFTRMGNTPFLINDSRAPGDRPIVTVPVCGAHAVKYTRTFRTRATCLGFSRQPTTELGKFNFSRVNTDSVAIPMRLSPEGANLDDLRALTKFLVREKTPILTFTFHSTSLTPGATDYTNSEKDVDRFLDLCAQYFTMFTREFGGEIISAHAMRALFASTHEAL